MKCLTIRQPWAWLIFNGKPIENRDWPTSFRGQLAIHAAKGLTLREYQDAVAFVASFDPQLAAKIPPMLLLERGAVLGTVEMVDCVKESESPWFQGKYGHVYESPTLFAKPIPINGALGLWEFKRES